jgi:putative endonuclease
LQDGQNSRSYSFKNQHKASLAVHTQETPMNKEEQLLTNEPSPTWHVYIVCCKDNSFYTGVTTDLLRRIDEHNSGKKAARYTRSRRPVELVYSEKAASRSIASRREHQIKKLTLVGKKQLIKTYLPLKARGTTNKCE